MAEVIVVGAGISGLACARDLFANGVDVEIYEASDDVGGRIRTDLVEGYRLDRGFQILLTSYPETRRTLDLKRLELRKFAPGVLIRSGGKFHRLEDPLRVPSSLLDAILSPVLTMRDRFRLARLGLRTFPRPSGALLSKESAFHGMTTLEYLHSLGFSDQSITKFFKPFFGGVFLESELATRASFFRFMFKMFGLGKATVPRFGMSAIPLQIAERIPADAVHFATPAARITDRGIETADGREARAHAVVVATDRSQADRLLERSGPVNPWKSTCTVYFEAERSPIGEPIMALNGEGRGPINNVVVMTDASPDYSANGNALIAVNTVGIPIAGEARLVEAVRAQLKDWFGASVRLWGHLKTYIIPEALPRHEPGVLEQGSLPNPTFPDWLLVCGDHTETPSTEGAIVSGKKAAQEAMASLRQVRRSQPVRRGKRAA